MRTFAGHSHKHALHGITVVVETDGPELYVGRCDDIDEAGVHLRDADRHHATESDVPREEFLAKARRLGVWPNHRHLTVPAAAVRAVNRLADEPERT
jgi:hypothetical protein